jgi:hypothetical protein
LSRAHRIAQNVDLPASKGYGYLLDPGVDARESWRGWRSLDIAVRVSPERAWD